MAKRELGKQLTDRVSTKLGTWVSGSWDRAHRAFEKKSGWTSKQVEQTLNRFGSLKPMNRVFLGGLIVGESLLKKKKKSKRS